MLKIPFFFFSFFGPFLLFFPPLFLMKENALQRQGTLSILILNKTRCGLPSHGGGEGGVQLTAFPSCSSPLRMPSRQHAAHLCIFKPTFSPPFSRSLSRLCWWSPPAWSLDPRAMVHNFCCSSEHLKAAVLSGIPRLIARLNWILQTEDNFSKKKMHAVQNHGRKHTGSWKKHAFLAVVVAVRPTQPSLAVVQLPGCLLVLTNDQRVRVLRKFSETEKMEYVSLFPFNWGGTHYLVIHRTPF